MNRGKKEIEENLLNNDTKIRKIIDYFKEVAEVVSVETDSGEKILVQEYEKINYISNQSVLANFLEKRLDNKQTINKKEIIFPFGLNQSQMEAVYQAMNYRISVIEGPPGTGKTQTILNIIANAIMNDKTVAIASGNNSATDNIFEKLKQYQLDFICARLGNKLNQERFVQEQTGKYPDFPNELALEEEQKLKNIVCQLNQELPEKYNLDNQVKKSKVEFQELLLEQQYFEKYEKENIKINLKLKDKEKILSEDILNLKIEYEEKGKATLPFIFKSWIHFGIGRFSDYRNRMLNLSLYYARLFYLLKKNEMQQEINGKSLELMNFHLNKKKEELIEVSKKLLWNKLRKKYSINEKRPIYTNKEISRTILNFNYEYPVILSTTYSVKKSINANHIYDYVIIDEASQVDLLTGILALSCAKNIIIVGDTKQLPNIITSYDRTKIDKISKKHQIEEEFDYKHSFLQAISLALPDVPRTLLREHYRCHPKIIEFCNKRFYHNELIVATENHNEKDVLKVYRTPPGNHARGHLNERQIEIIIQEILAEILKENKREEVGIISPYREQRDALLEEESCKGIVIDTIHKFQGREKDIIILTTVDNQISNFVDNLNMINVAISRAKKCFRLVVSCEKQKPNSYINDFIKYVEYNNFEVVESNVKSIFDLLYKANYEQRIKYLKKSKKNDKIDYVSEQLTYNLIFKILTLSQYNFLDVAVHVPLCQIITIDERLNQEETKYAKNIYTHIDFVIYSKMDKKTILAIETDGYQYHKKGSKQSLRDQIKNKILEKYDIKLVRLKTTKSGEEEQIKEALNSILGI